MIKIKKEWIGMVGLLVVLALLFLLKGSTSVSGELSVPIELTPTTIKVYITGEVLNPDVYEVNSEDRLEVVIKLAGGFTKEANTSINLARKLNDGEMITVYKEQDDVMYIGIDILNYYSEKELDSLEGIGSVLSERIVTFREKNGHFMRFEDLLKVEGIGMQKMEQIKNSVEN